MYAWWELLSLDLQIFYTIAFASSFILIVQAFLMLFGIGNGDAEVDIDGASEGGLHILSVRTVVAFMVGWRGGGGRLVLRECGRDRRPDHLAGAVGEGRGAPRDVRSTRGPEGMVPVRGGGDGGRRIALLIARSQQDLQE